MFLLRILLVVLVMQNVTPLTNFTALEIIGSDELFEKYNGVYHFNDTTREFANTQHENITIESSEDYENSWELDSDQHNMTILFEKTEGMIAKVFLKFYDDEDWTEYDGLNAKFLTKYEIKNEKKGCNHTTMCTAPNQRCVVTDGVASCECLPGYRKSPVTMRCQCIVGYLETWNKEKSANLEGDICSRCLSGQKLVKSGGKIYCKNEQSECLPSEEDRKRLPNAAVLGKGYNILIESSYSERNRGFDPDGSIFSPYSKRDYHDTCIMRGYNKPNTGKWCSGHIKTKMFYSEQQVLETATQKLAKEDAFKEVDIEVSDSENAKFSNSLAFGESVSISDGSNECRTNTHCVDRSVAEQYEVGETVENNGQKGSSNTNEVRNDNGVKVGGSATVGGSVTGGIKGIGEATAEASATVSSEVSTNVGFTNSNTKTESRGWSKAKSTSRGTTNSISTNMCDNKEKCKSHSETSGLNKNEETTESRGAEYTIRYTVPGYEDSVRESIDVVKAKEYFRKTEGSIAESEIFCTKYEITADLKNPPAFSDQFKDKMIEMYQMTLDLEPFRFNITKTGNKDNDFLTLENATTNRRYDEMFSPFIRQFGTHFLVKATMGASMAIKTRIKKIDIGQTNKNEVEKCLIHFHQMQLQDRLTNVKTNEACSSDKVEKAIRNSLETEEHSFVSIGGYVDNSAIDWSKQDFDNPRLINYKILPILNLFDPKMMPQNRISDKSGQPIIIKKIYSWFLPRYSLILNRCKTLSNHRVSDTGDSCVPCVKGRYASENGLKCIVRRYKPGTPGDYWSPEEISVTRRRVLELIDPRQDRRAKMFGKSDARNKNLGPVSESALLRLAFHDCIRYADRSGGCDGCLNWKNMGTRSSSTPRHTTDNNGLARLVGYLEQIYNTTDFPSKYIDSDLKTLPHSLLESGKSRADLWAFAALVALEKTIERANYACDHDFNARQQVPLLEGRDKCDIKLTTPFKFKYGRADCIPSNTERPYETAKEEFQAPLWENGDKVLDFMKTEFNMSARHFIALSAIHGTVSAPHPGIIGTKHTWFGGSYLSNMYYKMLANRPMYRFDKGGDITFSSIFNHSIGNKYGKPISSTGWRVSCHTKYYSQGRGPCFLRPTESMDTENPTLTSDSPVESCHLGSDRYGNITVKKTPECDGATFDINGIQTGGKEHESGTNKDGWNNQFALNYEVGLYHKFDVGETNQRAVGCPGLEKHTSSFPWRKFLDGETVRNSNIMQCEKNDFAPEGTPVYKIVEQFADDHDIWAKDFLDAFEQMQANGYQSLEDAPQNSWLGYASLEGRRDIGDYASYIEKNAPLVFTNPAVDPFICSHDSGSETNNCGKTFGQLGHEMRTYKPANKIVKRVDPQCGRSYTTLTDAWRRIEYGVKHPTPHCDKTGSDSYYTNLVAQWYRFSFPSAPFAKIPTAAPLKEYVHSDMQSCGTYAVSWMEDSLPYIGQSPKDVTIYFAYAIRYPKYRSARAKIVACPAGGETMYLYYLPPTTFCYSAYCAL